MADAAPKGVAFQEAIDFYKQKVGLPTRTWTDLWEGMHARAFVVAGAVKAELIADFHNAVTRAIAEGRTLNDFRKDFDAIVARHGWSYKGARGWRSGVIYNTNMRMAHSAGRWQQAQRLKDRRPYLRYIAVQDSRTRPEHMAWHDTILPVDHPHWHTHTPPNGWNCRCTFQTLSESDLKRRGLDVTDPPEVEIETREINTPSGKASVRVPKGIDTGFGYNVGEAAFGRGADLVAMERHGPWEALSVPGGNRPAAPGRLTSVAPRASLGPRAQGEDGLRSTLRSALGADEKIFTDPIGGRVSVGQALVDHMLGDPTRLDGREAYFPLIPELIETPAEIWAGFAASRVSGRVSLRRRYVKLLDMGRNQTLGLVADLDGGYFSGITFFRGNARNVAALRAGLRIFEE
ncbi:MAG: phage minor head protein [Rhodospirillales bacterium]